MKNNFLKFGIAVFFALFYTLPALADPGYGGDDFDEEDPDPAPIDNWVLLLILGGIALGVYFIIRQRRKAIV